MLVKMLCVIDLGSIRIAFPQSDVLTITQASTVNRTHLDDLAVGYYPSDTLKIPVYQLNDELLPVVSGEESKAWFEKDFCVVFKGITSSDMYQSGVGLLCDKIESIEWQERFSFQAIPSYMNEDDLAIGSLLYIDDVVVYGSTAETLSTHIAQCEHWRRLSA